MFLTAVIPGAELVALVESLAPLTFVIDERRERALTLERPRAELVPGRGLRVRGEARVSWNVAGVVVPMKLDVWQLLLVPRVRARGGSNVLVFEPVLEELDLKLFPAFVDERVAEMIDLALAQHRHRLAWDFSRTLTRSFRLPRRLVPSKLFQLTAVEGVVDVSERELRFTVRFEARVVPAEGQPIRLPERDRRSVQPATAVRRVSRRRRRQWREPGR